MLQRQLTRKESEKWLHSFAPQSGHKLFRSPRWFLPFAFAASHNKQQHNNMYAATTTFARAAARRATVSRLPQASSTLIAQRSYHENIVEHYENPRNVGSLDKTDENVGTVRSYCISTVVQVKKRWIGQGAFAMRAAPHSIMSWSPVHV